MSPNYLDGGSLYLSIASLFTAQVAALHLSFGEQAFMVLTLMLTSTGIAGSPRATVVILMTLGVDALIDMGRTAVHVTGNCLAAAIVGKWEQA